MLIFRFIKLALESLYRNKIRTLLTTLGIMIGIMIVMIVLGLGESAEKYIVNQIAAFGSSTIYVEIKVPGSAKMDPSDAIQMVEGITITSLKEEDAQAASKLPNVKDVYSAVYAMEKAVYRNEANKYMIWGSTASFIDIDESEVAEGRFFTADEERGLARVAVLGSAVKEQLFHDADPIGQKIRVIGVNFRVIGMFKPRGIIFFQNYDEMIYLPLRTTQKLILGINHIPYFVVQVEDESRIEETAAEVRALMADRHNTPTVDKFDFRVTTIDEAIGIMGQVTSAVQILLLVLAGVSLLVGGVGIMNIMLVTVSERTREIGLRKAVGAKPNVILGQFLLESVLLTVVGGVLGILLGGSVVYLVAKVAEASNLVGWEFSLSWFAIFLAVGTAMAEGVIFGLYPAWRAAKLDPIQALRKE